MTARRILAVGWLVFLLYAYPGYMTTSAVDQLIDSRYGTITDWHSPVMTAVWRLVGVVIAGPAGMLFLQSGLLLLGAYVLLARTVPPRAAALASACVLVFPPVMATMAVISEEAQLAGFVVAAAAAVTSPRRNVRLTGIALATIGCGLREGAALATLPVIVLGFVWRDDDRRRVRYAIAAGTWLASTLLALGLDHVLVDRETRTKEVSLALLDVVGVVAHAGPLDDAAIRAQTPGVAWAPVDGLQARARRVHGKPARFTDGPDRVLERPATETAIDALLAARHALVRAEPRAYLAARWDQWRRILGGNRSAVYTRDTQLRGQRGPASHAARHSRVQQILNGAVRSLDRTPLFAPYVYAALAFVMFVLALRRRDRDAVMLLASGLAFTLALFVVTWDIEARYAHWLITATVLVAARLFARSRAGGDHAHRVEQVQRDRAGDRELA